MLHKKLQLLHGHQTVLYRKWATLATMGEKERAQSLPFFLRFTLVPLVSMNILTHGSEETPGGHLVRRLCALNVKFAYLWSNVLLACGSGLLLHTHPGTDLW